MWLETLFTEKPFLPKLLDLKIPKKVGAKYKNFGTLLFNDVLVAELTLLKKECQGKHKDIILKILQG